MYTAFTVYGESEASSESMFGSIEHSSKIKEIPKLRFSSDVGCSRDFIGRGARATAIMAGGRCQEPS